MGERFEMRVSVEWLARLDAARGGVPRATFVRRALEGVLGPKAPKPFEGVDVVRGGEVVASKPEWPADPVRPHYPREGDYEREPFVE